jgi:hypothetical protein
LWIENQNPITYKIVVENGVIPNIGRGVYSAKREYEGSGIDAGLFVLSFNGVYVITNQIGDEVFLDSNYPFIASGNYTIDETKYPTNKATIYKDTNDNYIIVNTSNKFVIYGDKLIDNDQVHERIRYDRNGDLITSSRVIFLFDPDNIYPWDTVASIENSSYVNFLLTTDEVDQGVTQGDIVVDARSKFDAKNYTYSFSPADKWNGWHSSTLTGVYSPFGDSPGDKKFGYLQYLDSDSNFYTKGFEITENNGVWSVVYQENNQTYTTASEPQAETTVFNNSEADPTSISLDFNGYITREKSILTTMFADDVV